MPSDLPDIIGKFELTVPELLCWLWVARKMQREKADMLRVPYSDVASGVGISKAMAGRAMRRLVEARLLYVLPQEKQGPKTYTIPSWMCQQKRARSAKTAWTGG